MREPEFRRLNDAEREAVVKNTITNKHPLRNALTFPADYGVLVNYERQPGGFCICTILVHRYHPNMGIKIYRGCSRRSYKDEPNRVRGEMIAFVRAVKYSRGLAV